MKVYVVTYQTESGDNGVLGVFENSPTSEQISQEIASQLPSEVDDGCPVYTNVCQTEMK